MTDADMPYLKTLPNFRKYIDGGAEIKHIKSIYPTITYPCHTTIATGVYPSKHGVLNNMPFYLPGAKDVPWLWYHDAVKVPDIFTAAKNAGYTTAAVFWPCTGNHPDIDWLIDEIWSSATVSGREAFKASGTSDELMREVVEKYDSFPERHHPEADTFVLECTAEIIRRYRPELLMLHPAQIDSYRHSYGVYSAQVSQGIREVDEHIGIIGRALEESGLIKSTNFVLTSDHGLMDTDRIYSPNAVLKKAGLITVENGAIKDWTAVCISAGMNALVYVKNRDAATLARVRAALRETIGCGVGEIYDAEQAAALGLSGDFSFALESDGITGFDDDWNEGYKSFAPKDFRLSRATHGYRPEKGPMPLFYAKGPSFSAVSLNYASLVDEAPTLAAAMGFEMPVTDGKIIKEILSEPK